jgi:crotonobetainyl-CoA:carnitine CoA-transferase CaiB-like acyl-CoA transferase
MPSTADSVAVPPTGPLGGVRVLDISTVVMGPYATQLLGDLGAEVIKVEDAGGDLSRSMGPGPAHAMSGVALNLHRNKRSIVIDLKEPAQRPLIEALVRWADVVVTNLRPGPLERLHLSYNDCAVLKPDIVFCQAQGWSIASGDADRPAYDDVIQTSVGIADLMERTTGQVAILPSIIADKICGQTIASSVLAALFHRERTGIGQQIEVPMFDTTLAFMLVEHLSAATTVPALGEAGYTRVTTRHRGPKRALDGWITILPYDTSHWRRLFDAAGRIELIDDPRFVTAKDRIDHADAVYALLGEVIGTKTVADWMSICAEIGVAAEPVRSLDEVIASPDVEHLLVVADHPTAGKYVQILPPVQFSVTAQNIARHAPELGANRDEIVRDLIALGLLA